MRLRFLKWLAKTVNKRYNLIFILCLLITVMFGYFAGQISMEMTWGSLIPDGVPAKDTFETVVDEFGSATEIVIALEGPGKVELIAASENLALRLRELNVQIQEDGVSKTIPAARNVKTRYETEYLANYGLMMVKAKDLRTQGKLYTDYNLTEFLTHTNDVLENDYVQNSDNLSKQENEAVRSLDGMYDFVESLGDVASGSDISSENTAKIVDILTIGEGYFLSNDKKMLLVFLTPTISLNAPIDVTVDVVNAIDGVLTEFGAQSQNISVSMTGGHVITRDEMEVGMEDTANNIMAAFIIILLVFMISFRMVTGPILAMLVLFSGITWDIGIAYIFLGRLNIMTAMCSVILIGLGVDFSIHILSSYTEFRHKGLSVEKSLYETFTHIGTGLITGAITTAAAFFALIFTSYSAYREFGFVVGVGILSCLIVSLFFLPSALIIKEKIWGRIRKNSTPKMVDLEFKPLGSLTSILIKRPIVTVLIAIFVVFGSTFFIGDVYMNQNYMDMEPEGLESVRLQREIPKRFNMSPDNIVAVFDDLAEVNRITDLLNERPAIGYVESITDYMPSLEKQNSRIPEIQKIAAVQNMLPAPKQIDLAELQEQLYRFSDNLTEMSSLAYIGGMDKVFDKTNLFLGLDDEGEQIGENRVARVIEKINSASRAAESLYQYQNHFRDRMRSRITTMANSEIITLDDLPQSIKDRYISKNGDKYLISIYSKKDIWDGLFTTPFLNTVLKDVPGATGMPVLMAVMIKFAKDEGGMALIYSFIAFFVILLLDFRSFKISAIAALPLISAFVLMLGIMGLFGFPFSVVNVIGLPLILGIGIDDGVHIIHRARIEGRKRLPYTISSIGKAVLLTSLTTMLGFGSLIPSSYKGYASLGILVTLGIGLCFVTSVIFLPAIIKLVYGGKRESEFYLNRAE